MRVFKSAWFSKAAKKARISDSELLAAIRQVALGQADDLGGGVYKKRLDKNRHRSIVLARSQENWVYEYLFAKKDRGNITDAELQEFRRLAKAYGNLTPQQVDRLLRNRSWVEIQENDEDQV